MIARLQAFLMHRAVLALEFLLLCVVLPTCIIVFRLAPDMFMFLWGAAGYCMLIYWLLFYEGQKALWHWDAVTWGNMKPILLRWVAASIFMLVFIWLYDPEKMFGLLSRHPEFVPFLLLAYPILSALPQEFIFCSYFFKRYAPFFQSERARIIASAIVFAYAHVLFINWVAPVFSFVAGLIFAITYAKTRSLALVTIEHGLYGNVLFLVGLGWYFYGGAIEQ